MSEDGESWLSDDKKASYAPGSYGCHEAFHVTSLIEALVAGELVSHPSIMLFPEWKEEAEKAHLALTRLYKLIGAKHLT